MVTSTPLVTTRVAKTPVVVDRTCRPKISSIVSGRPRSRLSAISASKNARPDRGASNTSVREVSTCRIEHSHQYPPARSAAVRGSGSRAHQRSRNTPIVRGPSRSQIACNTCGSEQDAKPLDSAVNAAPSLLACRFAHSCR